VRKGAEKTANHPKRRRRRGALLGNATTSEFLGLEHAFERVNSVVPASAMVSRYLNLARWHRSASVRSLPGAWSCHSVTKEDGAQLVFQRANTGRGFRTSESSALRPRRNARSARAHRVEQLATAASHFATTFFEVHINTVRARRLSGLLELPACNQRTVEPALLLHTAFLFATATPTTRQPSAWQSDNHRHTDQTRQKTTTVSPACANVHRRNSRYGQA